MEHCRKHLGDNVTILYDDNVPPSMKKMAKEQGKEARGPWESYQVRDFYGWEAERVVTVTGGENIMELITRAKTHLAVIFTGSNDFYEKHKKYFQLAVDMGLVV